MEANKEIRFGFGKNWNDYVQNFLDAEKLLTAEKSLLKYLPAEDYQSKTFVDIGCGSGIFSLSALRLGASKVISFDVDKNSVSTTKLIQEKFASEQGQSWEVFEGSILDQNLVNRMQGQGDIVYSWGVLHHTGNMNQAIKNSAGIVKPNGYFIVALYNRAPSSKFWVRFKKFYNQTSGLVRFVLNYSVYFYIVARRLLGWVKSFLIGRDRPTILKRERGMSIYYDVVDWLGGYPYEFATFDEARQMVEALGFKLIKGPTQLPSEAKGWMSKFSFYATGCNEFVFQKNP